jgi:methylated-DNA-[protein]-cysteine S-methyltransferase
MLPLYKTIQSPVGELILVARGTKLAAILWENERLNRVRLGPLEPDGDHPTLKETERQLLEYFAGQRRHFELDLDFAGTDFQVRVWQPTATRAVGAANGRNPISIIAPCHRVIGTSGSLTGFAGGLAAKQFLLSLEGQQSLQLAF